jgi:hypothetical protein
MLVSLGPRVCEIIPFRSQGHSTLLFDYNFGVVRLPKGWAGTGPRAPLSSTAREAPVGLLLEQDLLETRVWKRLPVDRVLAPEGDPG